NPGNVTTAINSVIVHLHNVLALFAISLDDGMFHLVNSKLIRNYFRYLEEGALHDGVCPGAEAQFFSNAGCIDDVEIDLVFCEILFHMIRQLALCLFCIPDGVQEEGASLLEAP